MYYDGTSVRYIYWNVGVWYSTLVWHVKQCQFIQVLSFWGLKGAKSYTYTIPLPWSNPQWYQSQLQLPHTLHPWLYLSKCYSPNEHIITYHHSSWCKKTLWFHCIVVLTNYPCRLHLYQFSVVFVCPYTIHKRGTTKRENKSYQCLNRSNAFPLDIIRMLHCCHSSIDVYIMMQSSPIWRTDGSPRALVHSWPPTSILL